MKHKILLLLLGLLINLVTTQAQDWNQLAKIVASDRAEWDFFGISVSISGDYAIVGAYLESEDADGNNTKSGAGSAYIFYNNGGTWEQVQKIVASDRATLDYFGISVSISDNFAIVGAYGDNNNSGAAYIFKNNDGIWEEVGKLIASDNANNDEFGGSVSISGNYAIVGAEKEDENSEGNNTLNLAGSAYIFYNNGSTWEQVQKIVANDREDSAGFGNSVSISGDYAFIGASKEDKYVDGNDTLSDAGSAYIFYNNGGTWEQVQKITASDRAESDRFGSCVSISDNYAIIGAYSEDEDTEGDNTKSNAGSAYIFFNNGSAWEQVQKIVASDRAADDWFGVNVSISNYYAIVGACTEDHNADGSNTLNSAGSAYIFHNNGSSWEQVQKIVASDRSAEDWFGYSVSISDSSAIVGAWFEDQDGSGGNTMDMAGSAYIFTNMTIPVPDPPVPISPANGSVDQPTSITLSWNASSGATSYHLQVDNNNDFSSPFYDQDNIASTSQQIDNLNTSSTYYWRLNASNIGGTSSWSVTMNFVTSETTTCNSDFTGGSNPSIYIKHIDGNYYDFQISFNDIGVCSELTITRENVLIVNSITLTMDFGYPIEGSITGTVSADGNRISGTYSLQLANCGVLTVGQWSATRISPCINGTNELSTDKQIKFYPNPVSDILYFEGIENELTNISILSLDGKLLLQINEGEINHIDMSHLPKGIYLVKIANSKLIYTKKIIKQ